MIIRYIDKDYQGSFFGPGGTQVLRDGKTVFPSWVDIDWNIFEKYGAEEMVINKSDPKWELAFCHELGHVLDHLLKPNTCSSSVEKFRQEVRAWRIAKTFCKDKYWDEDDAIYTIRVWAEFVGIKVNWDKFKVVPLIQGKRKVRK